MDNKKEANFNQYWRKYIVQKENKNRGAAFPPLAGSEFLLLRIIFKIYLFLVAFIDAIIFHYSTVNHLLFKKPLPLPDTGGM